MKIKTQYTCQACGYTSPKWLGRCPGCEAWSSFVEERPSASSGNVPAASEGSLSSVREEFRTLRDSALEEAGLHGPLVTGKGWVALDDDESDSEGGEKAKSRPMRRHSTGMAELDRVLGGGMVVDSFTLLGGDPGIGKSTLLLQMARGLLEKQPQLKLLYVSGEESIDQIRGRARRLGVRGGAQVFLAAETQLERVFAAVKELKPDVVVMDSLQTFSSGFLQGAPGSVGQVREVSARLMALAKSARVAVWLVGHVTKEGSIAGPKVVEHMVDTVLYFEGEGGHTYRLLRTVKNRFGSTRELGVFEMEGEGLREVTNPSALFLSERKEAAPGTATTASLEGSRPLLVELQALVAPTGLAVPRRTSVGMEGTRISLIAAILERHMGLKLANQDLFFNVAGGLRLAEPACDLAAAAAIWSSFEDQAFPTDWLFVGELGLTGEVRRVSQLEVRLTEAKKLGFQTAVVPKLAGLKDFKIPKGLRVIELERVRELSKILKA
jgi:DNA repair protein RadA/Sms